MSYGMLLALCKSSRTSRSVEHLGCAAVDYTLLTEHFLVPGDTFRSFLLIRIDRGFIKRFHGCHCPFFEEDVTDRCPSG